MNIFKQKIFFIFFLLLSSTLFGQDRYNYAEVWNGWNIYSRYVFLWGFQDGGSATYLEASKNWLTEGDLFKEPELPKVKIVREKTALFFDLETIRDVVTELYKEPANSYIPFDRMIFLARDKLRGDDIEEAIRQERKEAHENYLIMQKIKSNK